MTKEQFIRLFIKQEPFLTDIKVAIQEYTDCTNKELERLLEYIEICKIYDMEEKHIDFNIILNTMFPYFENKLEITYLYTKGNKLIL